MRKRRLLNEVHCGIWIKFGYQQDHNAPNFKLYARAPIFAKRSMISLLISPAEISGGKPTNYQVMMR